MTGMVRRQKPKKGRATWEYTIELPRGLDGERRQEHRRGYETRELAERAMRRRLGRLDHGEHIERTGLVVADYLEEWLLENGPRWRPSTRENYEMCVRVHIRPAIGQVPLQAVSTDHLNEFYRQLSTDHAPRTVQNIHRILHKAFKDAIAKRLLFSNPADSVVLPKTEIPETVVWSAVDVERFLKGIKGHWLEPAFFLKATTGMRRGEVRGLLWSDVDLDRWHVSVQRALVRAELGPPKTSRGRRRIPIPLETVEVLRRWEIEQKRQLLALGLTRPLAPDYVFTTPDGRPLPQDTMGYHFGKLCRELGLTRIRLHDLRHTFATIALDAGVPTPVVSQLLGHVTPEFTAARYQHVLPPMMEGATDRIADEIFGAGHDRPTRPSNGRRQQDHRAVARD